MASVCLPRANLTLSFNTELEALKISCFQLSLIGKGAVKYLHLDTVHYFKPHQEENIHSSVKELFVKRLYFKTRPYCKLPPFGAL